MLQLSAGTQLQNSHLTAVTKSHWVFFNDLFFSNTPGKYIIAPWSTHLANMKTSLQPGKCVSVQKKSFIFYDYIMHGITKAYNVREQEKEQSRTKISLHSSHKIHPRPSNVGANTRWKTPTWQIMAIFQTSYVILIRQRAVKRLYLYFVYESLLFSL